MDPMSTQIIAVDEAISLGVNYLSWALHMFRQVYAATPSQHDTQVTLVGRAIEGLERIAIGDMQTPGLDAVDRLGLLDLLRRKTLAAPAERIHHGLYRVATADQLVHEFPVYYYTLDERYGTDETPDVGFGSPFAALAAAAIQGGIPPGGQYIQ